MRKRIVISLSVVAVLLLSAATAMSQSDGSRPEAIRVMGSVVVTRVIEPWAKEFQKIEPNASVILYGSSDAAGFQSVLAKDADVAMSITEPSDNDREEATRKGIRFVEHPVGYVTGAIIVHKLIPVEAPSRDNKLRIVGLRKDENTPSAMPPDNLTPEDAMKTSYPLIKPLLLYCDVSAKRHVQKFVEFCVDKGREMNRR
ncbi:MAG: substrate-binding domain-containing protein [Candidatus Lindowbacteria bacterium]|nr:substrate-binding domain-containing protein [Candidatus Lindowbacteria bacterium]